MDATEFDALVDSIQDHIFEDAKNALGERGFDRWRNPKFCGVIEEADGYAKLTGGCGDTMEMYLVVKDGTVEKVSYMTDGCSSSSIAGSFAAEIARGKRFEEVLDLRGTDVLEYIGSFPEKEEHCAHLAITTLQEALNSYLMRYTQKQKDG